MSVASQAEAHLQYSSRDVVDTGAHLYSQFN